MRRLTCAFLRAALFLCSALWAAALSIVEASLVATCLADSSSPEETEALRLRNSVFTDDLYRRFSKRCRSAMRTRLRCCGLLAIDHLLILGSFFPSGRQEFSIDTIHGQRGYTSSGGGRRLPDGRDRRLSGARPRPGAGDAELPGPRPPDGRLHRGLQGSQ